MSALINQARSRVPRIAEAAVERARLTVVPRTAARRAARVPFMVLVSLVLVGGVAGLLCFNTSMQQASFTATSMEDEAQALDAQQQSLTMELDALRDPQRVAARAQQMGMVPENSPAFLRLSDGKVLGKATPAARRRRAADHPAADPQAQEPAAHPGRDRGQAGRSEHGCRRRALRVGEHRCWYQEDPGRQAQAGEPALTQAIAPASPSPRPSAAVARGCGRCGERRWSGCGSASS